MFSLTIFLVFILILILLYLLKKRRYYFLHWKLPGSFGYPFLGVALNIRTCDRVLNYMHDHTAKYGSPSIMWIGPLCYIIISDPETAETVLNSPHCLNRSLTYKFIEDFQGGGLFTANVPSWNVRNRLVKPAFKRKILINFFSIFNRETNNFVKLIEKNIEMENFPLHKQMQILALQITTQTTLGVKPNESNVDYEKILHLYADAMVSIVNRLFHPIMHSSMIYCLTKTYRELQVRLEDYLKFVYQQINTNKAKWENKIMSNSKVTEEESALEIHSFLDYIYSTLTSKEFTVHDVKDEVLALQAGAFETTSVALYNVILCLSMNPQYQERVYEELVSVFPNKDFEVKEDDLKYLRYTEMCINEALRVIAPVPIVGRKTDADVILQNGVVIPKGTELLLDIFNMQRNSKFWGSESKIFNPEHFNPDNLHTRHPYAYIPFTKGIRMCIGFRYSTVLMKIFISKIFRNYKITADRKLEDLVFIENISMKIKEDPKFIFEKRID